MSYTSRPSIALTASVVFAAFLGLDAHAEPPTAPSSAPSPTPAAAEAGTPPAAAPAAASKDGPAPAPGPSTNPGTATADTAALSARLDALQAELDAMKAQAEVERATRTPTTDAVDPDQYAQKLSLYGFMDMGLQRFFPDDVDHGLYRNLSSSAATTFVVGNINLYFDAQPVEGWRALAEVRFTNYPNGNQNSPEIPNVARYDRTKTTIFDVNSANGGWSSVRWGSTVIERAYVQWTGADWFTIRVGQFLTPYGIWNVDHGQPTLIALMQPALVVSEYFPRSQVGVEMLGTTRSGAWDLGYHAYVSNGRTPTEQDFTDDKMVGGRLFARTLRPLKFQVGTSAFGGRNTDVKRSISELAPNYTIQQLETVASDEWGVAGDVSLDAGPLRLRTEFALNRSTYDDGKRPIALGQPNVFTADRTRWAGYILAAYQLPVAGLEPYLYFDLAREPLPLLSEARAVYSGGLNIHFTEATQLKLQYMRLHFFDFRDSVDRSKNDAHSIATRLVVAF